MFNHAATTDLDDKGIINLKKIQQIPYIKKLNMCKMAYPIQMKRCPEDDLHTALLA